MIRRPTFGQADRLLTETLRIAVPLNVKTALTAAARRRGTSVAGIVREAVEHELTRSEPGRPKPEN